MTDTALNEILEELEVEDPVCSRCDKPMVSGRQWKRASVAERAELLEEGYDVVWSETLCRSCHNLDCPDRYVQRTPEQKAERRDRTWKGYVACTERGMTSITEIACELGITPDGLRNALRRAKLRGDIPS